MRRTYSLLVRVAAPLVAAASWVRGWRSPGHRRHLAERFGRGPAPRATGGLWLHAVSLGEVNAAGALVRALRERHPHLPLLLTTATPTGRARAEAAFGETVDVRYLPYDTPAAVARFLAQVRPVLGVVLETELWPNLFAECARRGIPMVLASARLSARSVRRYRRFPGLCRALFAADVTVAAQSAADAQRFAAIGADPSRVLTLGNLKFDYDPDPQLRERARVLRESLLGARPVWVAGSTHAGEEEIVLEAHRRVLEARPDALLVLAPRHPQRFDAAAAMLASRRMRHQRRSDGVAVPAGATVLLLDSIGELTTLYGAADLAFVGGSLVPIGGHNLLEVAALGVPVLTGPHQDNGRDVAALLVDAGAARIVRDEESLARAVLDWLQNEDARNAAGDAGRAAVESRRGGLARLLDLLEARLGPAVASRRQ
ncbi:MAG: lipid IV(A) 3-deoxy-D-manno-octulosonic acid transferase [Gammaproteobacteria bacterium]|nr:lipid IV(A) 3-deoxy-D-manno-octulosonic acid transferase [Gammaproteobacteria bacterium]